MLYLCYVINCVHQNVDIYLLDAVMLQSTSGSLNVKDTKKYVLCVVLSRTWRYDLVMSWARRQAYTLLRLQNDNLVTVYVLK